MCGVQLTEIALCQAATQDWCSTRSGIKSGCTWGGIFGIDLCLRLLCPPSDRAFYIRFLGRVPSITVSGTYFESYSHTSHCSRFVLRHWNVCAAHERLLFKNKLEICFSGYASSRCVATFCCGCCQRWFELDMHPARSVILLRFGVSRVCSDLNSLSLVFHLC